jgi:hypothetical protein
MAKSNLPDLKRKQKLLFAEDAQPEALIAQGQRFLDAGWLNDAIDFWQRAGHTEGLQQIQMTAVEQGDAFLFNRCLHALDEEAPESAWQELADRARELGKLQFAREGYRMSGDRKAMERVEQQMQPGEPTAGEREEEASAG